MFTSFGARTMTLRMPAPASAATTASSARASFSSSSSEIAGGTSRRALTLPLIWTTQVTASSTTYAGSATGKSRCTTESVWPSLRHSSSAMCGASGAISSTSCSATGRGSGPPALVRWLFSSVILAMAVLKRSPARSPPAPSIALCRARSVASSGSASVTVTSPVVSSTMLRHRRCSSRYWPTTARVSQGRETSSGPIAISYRRRVSAPYSAQISSGVTAFFRDLPILPSSRLTGSPSKKNLPSRSSTSAAGTGKPRLSR